MFKIYQEDQPRDYSDVGIISEYGLEHHCMICEKKLPNIRNHLFYCDVCLPWLNEKNILGIFNGQTEIETIKELWKKEKE